MSKNKAQQNLENIMYYVFAVILCLIIIVFTALVMFVPSWNETYVKKFDEVIIRGLFKK